MKVPERCNCCGKTLQTGKTKSGEPEEVVRIQKEWGYFSKKDLECHSILLCENCYDNWIRTFKIPVKIRIKKEVLSEGQLL